VNAPAAKTSAWPRLRFWLLVGVIFGAHVGAIYLLGERKPIVPRKAVLTPQLRLTTGKSEFLALNNPTLLALPHPEGFSGPMWMHRTRVPRESYEWAEPQRWLALPLEQMGGAFIHFITTNAWRRFSPDIKAAPQVKIPARNIEPTNVMTSSVRVEGDLASRRLLNMPAVPQQASTELLTETVVQVLVDNVGNVISRTLRNGSGSKEADNFALNLARTIRFAPKPNTSQSDPSWTIGRLIFQWVTVPVPQTNGVTQPQ
jgi:TonB family protein